MCFMFLRSSWLKWRMKVVPKLKQLVLIEVLNTPFQNLTSFMKVEGILANGTINTIKNGVLERKKQNCNGDGTLYAY